MVNAKCAFKLLARGDKPPPGYNEILCHLVFDVKLDMTRKARYVAGGHLTNVPANMTYSSVVSRDTVRIGFLVAALNDLDILAGDIQNAFLSAPTEEKIFFYAGDEWGADKDRVVVVVRALYGLKSSALQFRNHLAATLGNKLGFKSCLADPDLWYKACIDSDGNEYVFVDSDHAGDKVTRRSQTGILLYLNSAPIIWYSKRQATVESSTFGSEFVALRIASELIISMRYKLRMMGVPIEGPTHVFCDNEAVYKNSSIAHSTLKKKHNSICFHRVQECVAAGIQVMHKVDSVDNLSDILTKSLPAHIRK
ncbi:Blackbeard [Chaetoceros tenuissimus]|uniref:Blackbeard n=1 Tax=Chaetoceros tenuissimus TaxID=426638 RepID=A0AAD3CNJ7_9STRA|nr:Blackbeard [Chaetoceros tenuissimus]